MSICIILPRWSTSSFHKLSQGKSPLTGISYKTIISVLQPIPALLVVEVPLVDNPYSYQASAMALTHRSHPSWCPGVGRCWSYSTHLSSAEDIPSLLPDYTPDYQLLRGGPRPPPLWGRTVSKERQQKSTQFLIYQVGFHHVKSTLQFASAGEIWVCVYDF